MKKNPLREVLEKIFYTIPREKREFIIFRIKDNKMKNKYRTVTCSEINEFDKGYVYIKGLNNSDNSYYFNDSTPIPFHLILEIFNEKSGEILYEKKSKKKNIRTC
ncbi:MAG: hypothetical protein ACTSRA_02265 [Promethearchaeota archaeon]